MKKILFLFSIVLLCSCNAKSDGSDVLHAKEDTVPFRYVEVFKYKGHSYIKFADKGVVHDPDCQYCYDKFD
nr:MAG TPA: TRAF PROTEIN, TRAO PROTEIN, TRAN ADHESION, BACTERIAL SECRETION.5A [Bacteriophage sp.]